MVGGSFVPETDTHVVGSFPPSKDAGSSGTAMSQHEPKATAEKSGRLKMLDDAVALGDDLTACVIRAFISNDRRRGPGRSTAHYSKLADSLALAAEVPESLMYAMMNWMRARHDGACPKAENPKQKHGDPNAYVHFWGLDKYISYFSYRPGSVCHVGMSCGRKNNRHSTVTKASISPLGC